MIFSTDKRTSFLYISHLDKAHTKLIMKSNKLASIALVLWILTITVFAWFFIRGNTTTGTDGRTAVVLQVSERDLILSEMRGLLSATQGILEGVNQGDMQRVIQASSAAGMVVASDASPALMTKLPLELKSLGMSVHRDMDAIAKAAENKAPASEILKMLSNTLTKCVACHSTWQLKVEN
ncbi:conserved hypothetical protein [Candidatus Nitrotoga sp. HW29]|nr:conserved hypothetical protein [Candidatus Nitrotoga sp. HW29]